MIQKQHEEIEMYHGSDLVLQKNKEIEKENLIVKAEIERTERITEAQTSDANLRASCAEKERLKPREENWNYKRKHSEMKERIDRISVTLFVLIISLLILLILMAYRTPVVLHDFGDFGITCCIVFYSIAGYSPWNTIRIRIYNG